jgi:hypothetical protein
MTWFRVMPSRAAIIDPLNPSLRWAINSLTVSGVHAIVSFP